MREAVAAGRHARCELDELARDELDTAGAIGLSKNYPTYKPGEGFPGRAPASASTRRSSTASPAHGMLKDGDVVTLDLAPVARRLLLRHGHDGAGRQDRRRASQQAAGRDQGDAGASRSSNIKPGKQWSDIARLMQYHVERNGFQRRPRVRRPRHRPHDARGPEGCELRRPASSSAATSSLKPGMTLAVEPMVVMGRRDVVQLPDNVDGRDGGPDRPPLTSSTRLRSAKREPTSSRTVALRNPSPNPPQAGYPLSAGSGVTR